MLRLHHSMSVLPLLQVSTMQATRGKRKAQGKPADEESLSVPGKRAAGTLADIAEVRSAQQITSTTIMCLSMCPGWTVRLVCFWRLNLPCGTGG